MKSIFRIVSLLAIASFAWAEVDNGQPDLSIFKLRRVDIKELARKRAGQPIVDLATGAMHMHESLFVDANYIKCPSYAHLFKLIKLHAGDSDQPAMLKQSTVESLAVVVNSDRGPYYRLFVNSATGVSADHFIEAASLLEKSAPKSEAWLDLLSCMSEYMASNEKVAQYLSEPRRKMEYESMAKFKTIPVEPRDEQVPAGLTRGLVRKLNAQLNGNNMDEASYREAVKLIESFDDVELREARRKAAADHDLEGELVKPISKLEQARSIDREPEGKSDLVEEPIEIELIVPDQIDAVLDEDRQERQPQQQQLEIVISEELDEMDDDDEHDNEFDPSQLAILSFIKMRLQPRQTRYSERELKLSINMAFDFMSHWTDLRRARVNPRSKFGAQLMNFRDDPENIALAERVTNAIENYSEIVSVLTWMKLHENKYDTIDDLRLPFEKLTRLLNSMDRSFDVDDLRRLHSIWTREYTELSTIDRFINSDDW